MNIMCGKCSNSSFYLQQRGIQIGFFCDTCGAWIKWASKKEQEMLKKRGMKIYPQTVTVELKAKKLDTLSDSFDMNTQNMGLEIENKPIQNMENNMSFGSNPAYSETKQSISIDMETEIQRRVAEELKKINSDISPISSNVGKEEHKTGSEYCPICDGSPLTAESGSKVEVSIFSGVMTITDIDGVEILGLYRLKNCPNCGKMF